MFIAILGGLVLGGMIFFGGMFVSALASEGRLNLKVASVIWVLIGIVAAIVFSIVFYNIIK